MTALAAYWRLDHGEDTARIRVEKILRAQQIYSTGKPRISDQGELALGCSLYPLLPEDRFDTGPISGGGGRWVLAADVRLDARDELSNELGIDLPQRKSMSDSMLVMRAIERWHENAIPRVIGDFALILWDSRKNRLILARDFAGQRPLHYHQNGRFFVVASMPKGVRALPDVPSEPDENAIAEFLALFPQRGTDSFFRSIRRVLPGEMVVISADEVHRRNYWNFEPKCLKYRDEEYVEATRECFDRAVAARIRSVGGVGSHLSGGLDSSTVTATAARLISPNKLVAFTAAPRTGYDGPTLPGRFNDESGHASLVAAAYANIEHVILRGSGRSPLEELDRNFFLYDRPILNLCNHVWVTEILSEARGRRLKVLLTGDLGNLTISYDGLQRLAELLAEGRLTTLLTESVLLRKNGTRLLTICSNAIGPFLPRTLWKAINRVADRGHLDITQYSAMRSSAAAALESKAKEQGLDFTYQAVSNAFTARMRGLEWIDDGNYQKGHLAGWGVDVRDPTADRRLVELCLSMPTDQFLARGSRRALVRRAFSDRVPQPVIAETRKGYQAADWHEGFSAASSDVLMEVGRIAELPMAKSIIDTDRIETLLKSDKTIAWGTAQSENNYRLALLRGISAGNFLRRAAGANT